jgi:hypothetical protein
MSLRLTAIGSNLYIRKSRAILFKRRGVGKLFFQLFSQFGAPAPISVVAKSLIRKYIALLADTGSNPTRDFSPLNKKLGSVEKFPLKHSLI